MSSYNEFITEKEKIDFLIDQDYVIKGVTENLSGAYVQFEYQGKDKSKKLTEVLHVLHADSRKYFSNIIINQKQGVS